MVEKESWERVLARYFGLSPVAGGLQAPARNGGAAPLGRAAAAAPVRNIWTAQISVSRNQGEKITVNSLPRLIQVHAGKCDW